VSRFAALKNITMHVLWNEFFLKKTKEGTEAELRGRHIVYDAFLRVTHEPSGGERRDYNAVHELRL
jgi:hypothetical protein